MKLPERVKPITEYVDPEERRYYRQHSSPLGPLHGNMLHGEPAFPRARYFTQRGEWDYAHTGNQRDAVSYRDVNYDPLVDSGRMELLTGSVEIVPGVELMVAPGHNRDMMIVKATSGGRTFCMLADLVPTSEHLKPTWVAAVRPFSAHSHRN